MLALYARSIFCLQPAGDWPTRIPATTDCILLGGIPVFFHAQSVAAWPVHWGSWVANGSVFLDYQRVLADPSRVLRALEKIPAIAIASMRAVLGAANRRRLIYSKQQWPHAAGMNRGDDALDVLMKAVAERARTST